MTRGGQVVVGGPEVVGAELGAAGAALAVAVLAEPAVAEVEGAEGPAGVAAELLVKLHRWW